MSSRLRELALEGAQVSEAGERIGVRLRLELARARLDVRLHRGRLDGAGGLDELLDRLGESLGVVSPISSRSACTSTRLERRDVAGHVGRARLASAAASVGERRGALGLLLRQVVRIALRVPRSRRRCRRSAPAARERSARSAVRGSRPATRARSNGRATPSQARRASAQGARAVPGSDVTAPDRTPANGGPGRNSDKIAAVSDLISIDEARGRVLEAVRPLGDEDVPLWPRARPSAGRGRDQRDRRAALRQLGHGRLRGDGRARPASSR